ncbi:MAG: YabP/YqfC family sporulation protein [Bacillota bacterium]
MKKKRAGLARRAKEIQAGVTEILEMPPEIVLDLPKLVLIGNQELLLQNHRGIIEYNNYQIRVSVSLGQITIKGEMLLLKNLKQDEILIRGKIFGLTLEE